MNGPVWHWIEADGRHWEASHAVLALQKTRVLQIRPRVALRRMVRNNPIHWVTA